MLKILPAINLNPQTKSKCGEIYYLGSTDYTINCCFCNMKIFIFEDFLLHMQNVHFENNSIESETFTKDCNVNIYVENDESSDEKDSKEELLLETFQNSFKDHSHDQSVSEADESSEEGFKILGKKARKKKRSQKTVVTIKNGREEFLNPEHPQQANTTQNDNLIRNIKETDKEFSCPECIEVFSQKSFLDQHVFEIHKGYKCSLCDKRFRLRHHLRRHIHTHSEERKYRCPIVECGRLFKDHDYLKHHLEVHSMERPFVCKFENCDKAYQSQRRLNTHYYSHSPRNKRTRVVCDICGYSCHSYAVLKVHQRMHTGEKPFICIVCEKGFSSKTGLNEHRVTHLTTRPHVCQVCNATFANHRILQRHAFIHSDEKKFKCKFCDSAFKQVHGLYGHVRRKHGDPKATTNNKALV